MYCASFITNYNMLVSIDYALLARFIEIGVFGMAFVYTIVGFAI